MYCTWISVTVTSLYIKNMCAIVISCTVASNIVDTVTNSAIFGCITLELKLAAIIDGRTCSYNVACFHPMLPRCWIISLPATRSPESD